MVTRKKTKVALRAEDEAARQRIERRPETAMGLLAAVPEPMSWQ